MGVTEKMIHEMLASVITWYMAHINYTTIAFFMAVESSFIPFPSEIVVPPAAWKAAQGQLNIFGVFGAATLGAAIGALFNYYLAFWLGRPIIHRLANTKIAHMMLITSESIEKAETYFNKHGNMSTLFGRLVPAIRQLISLPAGLSHMKFSSFLLYTIIGSALWNAILAILGYTLYSQKHLLEQYYHFITIGGAILGVLFFATIITMGLRKKQKTPSSANK
jgi:membrane protein DedA with SNARE-associated domain